MISLKKKDAKASKKKYLINYAMDDLTNDMREESSSWIKSVYLDSWAIISGLLAVYVILLRNHILGQGGLVRECLSFIFSNEVVEDLWDYVLENILLGLACSWILYRMQKRKEKEWIKGHQDYWLKGKWLHIHEKNDKSIRVGYVDFSQSYDDIAATSRNYDVENITDDLKTTDWHYVNAQINHDQDNNYGLRAFYFAKKKANDERNNGMHKLDIADRREKGLPVEMAGSFGDVNTFDADSMKSANEKYLSCGKIRMYRMTAEQESFLYKEDGSFDPEKLDLMLHSKMDFTESDSYKYINYVNAAVDKMNRIKVQNTK